MCTLKTVGIVILVIVLVIICFSLIGFVFLSSWSNPARGRDHRGFGYVAY